MMKIANTVAHNSQISYRHRLLRFDTALIDCNSQYCISELRLLVLMYSLLPLSEGRADCRLLLMPPLLRRSDFAIIAISAGRLRGFFTSRC